MPQHAYTWLSNVEIPVIKQDQRSISLHGPENIYFIATKNKIEWWRMDIKFVTDFSGSLEDLLAKIQRFK